MPPGLVIVVDDDASVREALVSLVRSVDLQVQAYASAREFLDGRTRDMPSCLVLDVRLPGLSGLQVQQLLVQAGRRMPIIFITGHGDIPMSVQAMKAGALEFLTKPFRDADLLQAIRHALERDRTARIARAEVERLRSRYATLTSREREVMALVVSGRLNKQSAIELGITEITVKVHRHHVMEKMGARSFADLVRMHERLNEPASDEAGR